MLMQVGGEGSRPTFFEMAAAQHLPSSLHAAMLYSVGVMAQRRPILHKVLDYSDEAFGILMFMLELHSLRTSDASFAEALYGLRRRPALSTSELSGSKDGRDILSCPGRSLTREQRHLSVLFLVGVPYLKSKMEAAYNAQRGGIMQAALWGVGDGSGVDFSSNTTEGLQAIGIDHRQNIEASLRQRLRKRLTTLCTKCYPWLHASYEGVAFAYQLLYLLDATQFYTPALQIMGLQVCRASGQELMEASKQIVERRNREFERLRGPPLAQAFQRGLLKAAYGLLDYAQSGLIAAVFLFKMLEWWYQSAEQRVTAPTVYPPPPPPPAPKVSPEGIPLPPDRTVCPLCLQKRTNPAMAAVSGYVFCYPCIYNYISQYQRCPVTLVPASEDQIRRLYYDA